MKHTALLVVLFILTFKISFAQFEFRNDTGFIEVFRTLKNQIDTTYNLTKDYDFEFRFWVNYGKETGTLLFVLTNKNDKWTARLFKRQNIPETNLAEIEVSNQNLNTLWAKLNKNHILFIKNYYELKDKIRNCPSIITFDCTTYFFELLTNNKKRNYMYRCPKVYRERYKYIKEYKWVVNMIKLIYKQCKLNPNNIG